MNDFETASLCRLALLLPAHTQRAMNKTVDRLMFTARDLAQDLLPLRETFLPGGLRCLGPMGETSRFPGLVKHF